MAEPKRRENEKQKVTGYYLIEFEFLFSVLGRVWGSSGLAERSLLLEQAAILVFSTGLASAEICMGLDLPPRILLY